MKLTKRQKWILLAGAASAIVAPVAERVVSAGWRVSTGEEPPEETGRDTDWGRTVAWTVITAVAVGLAQVAARRVAAATWEEIRGEAPPRKRRRRLPSRALRR